MSLQDELDSIHRGIQQQIPDEAGQFDADTEALVRAGVADNAPEAGERAPEFTLPDQLGRQVSSQQLLAKGPLVISFYRGSWCPYCSAELHALQQRLPQIEALGASLVAISPQLPDESLNTAEKHALSFPVLSDVDNQVARRFGLVFAVSEPLRPTYLKFGIDLPRYNGSDSFELPVPATFVVAPHGTIRAAHVSADYKQRMEPAAILAALEALR